MFAPQYQTELMPNPVFGIELAAIQREKAEQAWTFFGFVGEELDEVGVLFVRFRDWG